MYKVASVLTMFCAILMAGCSGNVESTEDSTRVEAEGPKLEVGDQKPDLDLTTDDDIDVDTPAPGDN